MRNTNLYIVCVVFNPRRFKSRYKLYQDFKAYMERSGAKLFTVEIAFADRPFEVTLPSNPMNLQLRTDSELWLKENGLNLGFEQLFRVVPDCYYIGWIDADVHFTRPDWVQETVFALEHYRVVQPFSEAHFLKHNGESKWKCPSATYEFNKRGFHQEPPMPLSYTSHGHPGLGWAIRRDVYEQMGGLMDFCIAGSGDTHALNAWKGDVSLYFEPGMSEGFELKLREWAERAYHAVQEDIGYVLGACMHAWHGASELRGYEGRWAITNFHKFNPDEDLERDHQGLYKWKGNKPKLEQDIKRSMSGRDEDSTHDPNPF